MYWHRVINDGMCLQSSWCGPRCLELTENVITTWSTINSELERPRGVDGIDELSSDNTEMPSDDDDNDDDYDAKDGLATYSDDTDDEEFRQQCEDYDLGFDVETSDEEGSLMTYVNQDAVRDMGTLKRGPWMNGYTRRSSQLNVAIAAPKLAPRFASYLAGRADRAESQVHLRKRRDAEEHLEDLCCAFSAIPKAVDIHDRWR